MFLRWKGMNHVDRPTWVVRVWPAATGGLLVLVALSLLLPAPSRAALAALAVLVVLAVALLVWAFFRARRRRRDFEERMEIWAGEKAAQEERLRIARDLHDLASHGLGLMTIRAATANLTDDDDDSERRVALADIERLGREATTELRRMLTVLRGTTGTPAPLRPADTLDDLPGIMHAATTAGLALSVGVEEVGEVTPGVQLTICAVVREALNNTLRYAGPTEARIRVQRTGEAIVVDIRDAGPHGTWLPHPGSGHGLAGLRERLALHGGTLTTGPTGHGFRVLAELPAVGQL